MRNSVLLQALQGAALLLLNAPGAAAQSCSGSVQVYNTISGYPNSNFCYPLNYLYTRDLGNTNPSDAQTRCEAQCSSDSQCNAYVAQLNKAADSNLYSGTCFFYPSIPTPRQCADKPTILYGEVKDFSLKCFSSSAAAATAFCSSYLSIGTQTIYTSTFTPKTTTTTTTTGISTSTTLTTTTTTLVISGSTTTTSFLTVVTTAPLSVITTTSTTTADFVNKRAVASVPPPACITSGTPSDRLSSACSCLSIRSTTTSLVSTTPTTVTSVSRSTTSTTTNPVSTSISITQTTTSSTITTFTTTSTTTTPLTTTTTTELACPAGNSLCSGACKNLLTDNDNCGSCGHICPSRSSCSNGQCTLEPCLSSQGTGNNCGAAGSTCSCYRAQGGANYCIDPNRGCGGGYCSQNSECGGGACLDNTYYQYGCCIYGDSNNCPNPSSMRRLFKKRASAAANAGSGIPLPSIRTVSGFNSIET